MFGFLARIFGFCTPDAASAAREGADQEPLACETYTAPIPHDARREHTTFVQEAVVQLDAVDFSVQSHVSESQTSARHNPSRCASSAGILEILNDSNGSTESVVSRTFDDAAAQATPFPSQPSDISGTVENQMSSKPLGNENLSKPATVDASEELLTKSDGKPLESASSELPKTVQSEVFSKTVDSGQDLEMKSDAKSLESAPSELPATVPSEDSSKSIESDEDLEVKSDAKPLELASLELPKTVQSEDSSTPIESEDLSKPVMVHASEDLETKSDTKPLDSKTPERTGSPTEIRKPLQHALADTCAENFVETTSNTNLCTALKELGIKGKSERKSVAKELLRLEQCCARGLENNPQAVYGRIVRHFCKSKQEIALLRVLQDRVSKQSEFRAFQDTLEDLDDNFDGTVSQEDFGRSLDTLGLASSEGAQSAFRQGLEALEFDVEREGVALERILYAFRVEDEAGIDYGQFLRFLRNDYDATLGCFDSSLSSLQRGGGDNDDDDDLDDDHHVAFHDTAKSGPFVAGLTDSRLASLVENKEPLGFEDDDAFDSDNGDDSEDDRIEQVARDFATAMMQRLGKESINSAMSWQDLLQYLRGQESYLATRALQDALRVYEDFSWEEYLSCVAEHASDVAVEELRRWADEIEVAIEFNELSRSARAAYGSAERLKAASSRLELLLESRLDVVDYAEGHPSLLDVYSLLGQMQALEALSEAEAFETRIESRIDQYLSSRSGRAATDEIVRGMMEADRVQRLSKGSRASAELAARGMLRKRKDAEFRAGPGQSVLVATRKEARQHLRTARTLSELVHGFESIEACSSMVACARFYLGCMDKRNDARAADLLSMVLAALDEMHLSASGSTFATIAHRLADLRASSKDYEDAGRLFARAGAIAESEGDAGLALTRWQRAFRAFDHVHGANDDQLQASSQVVALLNQVGDASAQSEAYEKHATVLLRSRQGAEAVRALRQAKALAVSRKRKVILSRLIASATSSAQLNELDPPNLGVRRDTRETKTTHQETLNLKVGAPASFDRDGNDEDDTENDDDDDDDADDPNDADLEFLLQLDDKS
ncbi:Hypothetical Protein FCC1311_059202 [Hondaea fermentalgiana]|uniref:EF-hand domain-containing protein n=1 Tax=Hondaea fermentalgiana TaxID=2315210 RepID=A0A2R5GH83_9STRA|nr:Hypothetical Protein FCC1311_059202 [Hondaea fermentalgiana]|eukprot:GBG29699.1 Hypothetical Protein FCC1311_059202 [Hondaea fermentalgiana]